MTNKHVHKALRTALGDGIEDRMSITYNRFSAGLRYASLCEDDRVLVDKTLAGGDTLEVARAVLVDGKDLATVGRELFGYKVDAQARVWAASRLASACALVEWHYRQRVPELCAIELGKRRASIRIAEKAAVESVPWSRWN